MKISTKGRYALRLLLDLASQHPDDYIALKDVAIRQNLSKKYLEQIVPILNRENMLQTNRGPQGGYRLTQTPDQYTVGAVLRCTENTLAPVTCLEQSPNLCPRCNDCLTLPVWQGLSDVINHYLDSITLQDLLAQKSEIHCNRI